MKAANGDWSIIHKELQGFLATYGGAQGVPKPLVHSNSNSNEPIKMAPGGMVELIIWSNIIIGDRPVAFKWDRNRCGTGIQLTESDTLAFLKENPYIFKTVIGDYVSSFFTKN